MAHVAAHVAAHVVAHAVEALGGAGCAMLSDETLGTAGTKSSRRVGEDARGEKGVQVPMETGAHAHADADEAWHCAEGGASAGENSCAEFDVERDWA